MKKTAFLAAIFLLLLGSTALAFQIQTGYYVGTGVSRSITGVGFQPDLVIIKADTSAGQAVWRSSTMTDTAYFETALGNASGLITSLDSNGFSLGTNTIVNSANVRYTWTAFRATTGTNFKVGSYTGNGSDDRNITGVGFQPNLVWVKRDGASLGVWYTSKMGADQSHYFSATTFANDRIQALQADGFQVGADPEVNSSGPTYHYVAFKAVSQSMTVESYTGDNNDNRSIALGFKPDFAWVKQSAAANQAVLRSNQSYGDECQYFTATNNALNMIQTFEANGFQVGGAGGTSATVNAAASTYYVAAFRGVPAPSPSGTFKMISGSYLSTGSSRSISGLGFRPDLVMIKADNANYGVFTTSLMAPDSTAYFANAAVNVSNRIVSIDNDGFTIGSGAAAEVNTAGITYRWVAFSGSPSSNFIVGAYTGTGATGDNRSIYGLGFQPDIVAVKTNTAQLGVFRTSSITGDNTTHFSATVDTADIIQGLEPDGFQVGTHARSNTAATTYFYLAFKQTTGQCTVGAYTGDALQDNRNIDGLGFRPGMVWIKRPEAANGAVFRAYNLSGDNSQYFLNTANSPNLPNIIQDLRADGFQIGTDATVNNTGTAYRYAAWKATSTKLAFTVQPTSATAGTAIAPDIKVAVQDEGGNTDTTDNSTTVTMSINTNPSSGTLSGTASRTVALGVATFNDLSIDKAGTGYSLIADATGRTSATSDAFNITPASANKLVFTVQPTQTVAGTAISPEVKVAVQDTFGNKVTSDNTTQVTIAIQANPGGGTLSGTKTRTAASGEVTFSGLSIDKTGSGYSFTATATLLTSGTSDAFNLTPASANKLAFTVQPSNTAAGTVITPSLKVAVQDQFSNIVTSDNTSQITLAIHNNPGGGALFGTNIKTASSGVTTFNDLYLNRKGDGYDLTATCPGLTSATSDAFNIGGELTPPVIQTQYPSKDAYNIPTSAQIALAFSQTMDQSSVNGAFSLKAIMDNTGISLDAITVAGTASWDAEGKTFYFIPSSLSKGYSYRSALTTSARDSDLIYLATAESWDFTVIYDRTKSNTIYSVDRQARVTLGSGTLPVDGSVIINRDPRNHPDYVDPNKITDGINKVLAEGNPYHYPIQSSITEFNLINSAGTRVATRFAESAILALYYTDANQDGIVDNTVPPLKERELLLYRLDENHGLWVRVPNSAVNVNENYVYAPVYSFSVYTIMSTPALNLSSAFAFPNPFKPSSGHTTVTFTNLASQCTIKIFTLSGDLVKTIQETDGDGQNTWDVKNDAGEALTSGLYLYLIKSSDDAKMGKLVIIK